MAKHFTEEQLEQIKDLPPKEQAIIYSQAYSCGDPDTMDRLDAAGAFKPEVCNARQLI